MKRKMSFSHKMNDNRKKRREILQDNSADDRRQGNIKNAAGQAGKKKEAGRTGVPAGRKADSGRKTAFDNKERKGGQRLRDKYAWIAADDNKALGKGICPLAQKCGGCSYQGIPYEKQLAEKQRQTAKLLKPYVKMLPIVGMENPYHYRNKVHAVFGRRRDGVVVSGIYQEGTHEIVNVNACQIENETADKIIVDIRGLLKSFKIKIYDEDTQYGLLRHVMIRCGHVSGQVMVVLVLASPILPSKNNFVKALRKLHPEITTVVLNINDRQTNMVLGERNITLYGKGYIEDELCGCTFRISPSSFYQVNPAQTEVLYRIAMDYAGLTGTETVIDAYCGIGTIGIVAAKQAESVVGVELNRDAVRDAVMNAKVNGMKNIRFYNQDAGDYMTERALAKEPADVVFMDPPRSGSTEEFLKAVTTLGPKRVVYISCNPKTLAGDLEYFVRHGYEVVKCRAVDMFPFSEHTECVVGMQRKHM